MTLHQIQPAKKKSPWYRSPLAIRQGVMLFFFVFLLHVAYDHLVKGGGPRGTPPVEAYCPFGGVESLYDFLTTGGYIRRIEPPAMILMVAVLLLTLVLSRGFCGWICPFGSVQEWLGMLGRKIFRKTYNPTGAWDRGLRYLKYDILAVIIGFTWYLGTLVFRPYDPFLAFFHLGQSIDEMPVAYALPGVVLPGSLKIERFFCKYACPLGAVTGVVGKLGLTKIVRADDGCKGCNLCQKKCFAHVDFLPVTTIQDADCNHCLDCVVHCPKPNVLAMKGAHWNFSHPVYAALLVAGLFATIGVSKATAHWRTRPETAAYTNKTGRLDPEQIRGWMTLGEISQGYGVPLDKLYEKSTLPKNVAPETRLNQVAKNYKLKFEPDAVREVVRELLGGAPHSRAAARSVEKAAIPPAAEKLAAAPKRHAPAQTAVRPEPKKGEGKKGEGKEHSGEEQEVKGFMTLNEVALKTGVPKDWLVKRLNIPESVSGQQPLREWMHGAGRSIQDFRDAVTEYRAGKR